MLLIERIKNTEFSKSEQLIVEYILNDPELMLKETIRTIASETFTNPTSVIRVANKLGFDTWNQFKKEFYEEQVYLNSKFNSIDANLPFLETDSLSSVVNKIAELEKNTISDTLSIIDLDELKLANSLINSTKNIMIFASLTNSTICHEFVRSVRRIGIDIKLIIEGQNTQYEAYLCDDSDCPILISYTGRNTEIVAVQNVLTNKNIPHIVLTTVGDDQLSEKAHSSLKISTREKLYSKIGDFSSTISTIYLLDILYSLVFKKNYYDNLKFVRETGVLFNKSKASTEIMMDRLI